MAFKNSNRTLLCDGCGNDDEAYQDKQVLHVNRIKYEWEIWQVNIDSNIANFVF